MPKLGGYKSYFEIHIAVLLFGFTAILGKFIVFDQLALVWHRMWIAVVGLLFFPGVIRGLRRLKKRDVFIFALVGVVVSLHWVSFFASVKLGNVSIALACMATTTLFISLLEPLITKSKFQWFELTLGIFIIAGILLILDIGEAYYASIFVGLLAAFLAALFSTLNKKHLKEYNPISVSAIELSSGFLFLTLVIPAVQGNFDFSQYSLFRGDLKSQYLLFGYYLHSFWYLLVLGLLCTSVAYALALASLRGLSAFSAGLAVNFEPIYGVIMAILIFNEDSELTTTFYLGTGLIFLSVFIHPVYKRIQRKRAKKLL
ncbi:MAG: drug/metabolite transporter (DMT)-like permease [bacterium]|jgi:drug/metabolite transporter (DMT)-like permease